MPFSITSHSDNKTIFLKHISELVFRKNLLNFKFGAEIDNFFRQEKHLLELKLRHLRDSNFQFHKKKLQKVPVLELTQKI